MSVVVAVKEKDAIYFACDCQGSAGHSKVYYVSEGNFKIWKYRDVDGVVVGGVGDAHTSELIRTGDYFDNVNVDRIDYDWMVQNFVRNVVEDLRQHERVEYNQLGMVIIPCSAYLIAIKDRLYSLEGDSLFLYEEGEVAATGSGALAALGSLESTQGEDIRTRLIKAVVAASTYDFYVNDSVVLMNTASDKIEYIPDGEAELERIEKKQAKKEEPIKKRSDNFSVLLSKKAKPKPTEEAPKENEEVLLKKGGKK